MTRLVAPTSTCFAMTATAELPVNYKTLLARSVPQIQVFVVGFPLTLMLGFLFLFFGMPFFAQAVHQMFEKLDTQYFEAIKLLSG